MPFCNLLRALSQVEMRTPQPQPDQDSAVPERRKSRRTLAKNAEGLTTQRGASAGWDIEGRARSVHVDAGLHALIIGKVPASRDSLAGVPLPLTQVVPLMGEGASVTVVSNSGGDGSWLAAGGGTLVLKASGGGGKIFVTTYGITDDAALPDVQIVNLDRLAQTQSVPAAVPALEPTASQGREISRELLLHIERQGDQRFSAPGWAGNPGERLRIEGFAIRPLDSIAPGHIEYMAFGPGGRPTPWVTDARLCGTRGRGQPLTGFAVRLAPPLRERFDVEYEGYFFDSGPRGPQRNGEPCLPSVGDDPLGAIRLRVVERLGA
jgi:hypothetical protein